MTFMDNNVFLFNESSQITFLLQLFYKGTEGRNSICLDAKIQLENNVIKLYVNEPSGSKIKELSSILTKTFKKKDYKIRNASINSQTISLKIDEIIRFSHFHRGQAQHTCSMILKKFYFMYKGTERPKLYRLYTTASNLLSPYLTGLSVSGSKVVGTVPATYKGSCYGMPFFIFRDEHHVYVQTEGNIEILLHTLSFFFCSPIEYDMVYSNNDNKSHVEVKATQYSILAAKTNNMLGYLFSGNNCLDDLFDYLNIIKSNNVNRISGNKIGAYIDNYVRAEYLDNISKLLLYSSILENIAGVKDGEYTYDVIRAFLCNVHINIDKINDNVSKMNLLDADNKLIPNFVKLRNFFVHHLGSKEAERFLNESDMLFYIKLTITILILKSIGVSEIIFDRYFHEISVFDETVEEMDYISNMLMANES